MLNKIFANAYKLGWFPALITDFYDRATQFSKKNLNNIIEDLDVEEITITFEKYYDNEEKFDILYHLTPLERWEKFVKVQGLTPKSQSKISKHPERVYLFNTLKNAVDLAEQLFRKDKQRNKLSGKYALIKVNSKDLDIYDDPDYDDGYYTYEKISTERLELKKIIEINIHDEFSILQQILNQLRSASIQFT